MKGGKKGQIAQAAWAGWGIMPQGIERERLDCWSWVVWDCLAIRWRKMANTRAVQSHSPQPLQPFPRAALSVVRSKVHPPGCFTSRSIRSRAHMLVVFRRIHQVDRNTTAAGRRVAPLITNPIVLPLFSVFICSQTLGTIHPQNVNYLDIWDTSHRSSVPAWMKACRAVDDKVRWLKF